MAEPHDHHVTKEGVTHLMKTLKKEQKDLEHQMKELLENPHPSAEDTALYKQLKKRHTEVRHKKHEVQKALNMLAEQGPEDMQHADFVQELKDPHAWEADDEPAGKDDEKSKGSDGSKRRSKHSSSNSNIYSHSHSKSSKKIEGDGHRSRSKKPASDEEAAATKLQAAKRGKAARDEANELRQQRESAPQPSAAAVAAAAPAAAPAATPAAAPEAAAPAADGKTAAQRHAEAKQRAEADFRKQTEEEEFRRLHPGAHAVGGAAKATQPMEMERPDEAMKHIKDEEMNYAKQHPIFYVAGQIYVTGEWVVMKTAYCLCECPCLSKVEKAEAKTWGMREWKSQRQLTRTNSRRSNSPGKGRPKQPVSV